ncbi:lamin-L(II)-like isoform X8 [Crassostrea angulata]|uniref:lamin-L(II)-like isoform X8 n=1 Tax=Magallana angulata TaxID=2784310 RepID=UPI0022B1B2C5|nr:lamin-L(II)-like isoform X8 [Crassostrea angulata]
MPSKHKKRKDVSKIHSKLSEGPVQGSPFITHLGDGDPNLQPHPQYLYRSSTPEEEQTLQLVIPGLDQSGSGENLLNNSGDNKEENTSETKEVDTKEGPAETSPPATREEPPRPQSRNSFVTSRSYLNTDKVAQPSKAFNKQVYFVSSSPEPHLRPGSRCTNVTDSVNRTQVTPVVENPYARVDSGYSSRYSNRSYSAGSIRKLSHSPTRMSYGMTEHYNNPNTHFQHACNRTQEREELQKINDRFTSYIQKVRHLREQSGQQADTTSFIKSTKILEDEVATLKSLYEKELDNVRKQLEEVTRERNSYQMQCSKNKQFALDLENRLMVESEKNRRLMEEMNTSHKRIQSLESELSESKVNSGRPYDDINNLTRDSEKMIREIETLKHRYEKEQLMRQEAEEKAHLTSQKMDFENQVYNQQIKELRERLETASATILSLETRIRQYSKSDTSVSGLLQQVRESAEEEMMRFKIESEENYARNITALKTQMENDAKTIDRLNTEKSQILGQIVELRAKITSLEGQIQNLNHQKVSLEEMVAQERAQATEQVAAMSQKLKDVQEMLFVKMREASSSHDCHMPLKAEISAMKALLEEEEKRLQVPSEDVNYTTNYTLTTQADQPPISTAEPVTTNVPPQSFQPMSYAQPSAPPMSPSYAPMTAPNMTNEYVPQYEPFLTEDLDPAGVGLEYFGGGTRYTYRTTPSVNKLQIEPSPPTTPRPVGPVMRAKSAPVGSKVRGQNVPLIPTSMGQGQDYFDEMFRDLTRETLYTAPPSPPPQKQQRSKSSMDKYQSSVYHDYNTATSSAVGDIKILEVNQEGKYVRLVNDGKQETEFGGHMIQQNVGGHPVAVYRFPPRTKFPANSTLTVWAGSNDPILHQPPSDYVWKEQQKWGTGPECTTILCKPNGQAIAWTTAAHRFTKNAFEEPSPASQQVVADDPLQDDPNIETDSLTEMTVNINEPKPDSVYLKREKQQPNVLTPQKHPHGTSPGKEIHPATSQPRPYTYGNDNSSVNRQSRSQTTRPDPVNGQPYAGSAQKMGSAPLKRYTPTNIRGNGCIVNKADVGKTSCPPNHFMSPHVKFQTGLDQIRSQHNEDFMPPMPRPPLFSTW